MKHSATLICCLLALALVAAPAAANPCTHPVRIVNGYTVDLQPLMTWWPQPKGMRPLSGWKHVRGTIVREDALGWVVKGKAEGQKLATTFFLKNPPRDTLRRFQELRRQLSEYQSARTEVTEFLKRPVSSDWYSYWLAQSQWTAAPISVAEYNQATARLAQIDHKITSLHEELAPMQDANGNFKVDAFALNLQQIYNALPVYDHGAVYNAI